MKENSTTPHPHHLPALAASPLPPGGAVLNPPKTPGKACPTCGHITDPLRAESLSEKDLSAFCWVWREMFGFTSLPTGGDAVQLTAGQVLRAARLSSILDPYVRDGRSERADQIDMGRLLTSICELPELPGHYQLRRAVSRNGKRISYFMLQLPLTTSEAPAEPAKTPATPASCISSFTKTPTTPEAF